MSRQKTRVATKRGGQRYLPNGPVRKKESIVGSGSIAAGKQGTQPEAKEWAYFSQKEKKREV